MCPFYVAEARSEEVIIRDLNRASSNPPKNATADLMADFPT